MKKTRQDAWSEKEDVMLAEIVLDAIKTGRTQLDAFKEASEVLNRTSGACGFRWNATLRKQYEKEIIEAKNNRVTETQNNTLEQGKNITNEKESAYSLLEKVKQLVETATLTQDDTRVQALLLENKQLKERLKRYETAWNEMKQLWEWVYDRNESADNK